jgi:hypothetical protein
MADLNIFNCTAKLETPFEKYVENGIEYAKAKLAINNHKDFYAKPWVIVEGTKVEEAMRLAKGQGVKIRNATIRSSNRTLECPVSYRTLSTTGQLEVKKEVKERSYTDVFLFIDEKDGSEIIESDHQEGRNDINSFTFTGRICTEPSLKIVGRNKHSLSFVSASNFSKKDMKPSFLYVVVEGNEAKRLDGRLAVHSKFSGNAILRTKTKSYVFEYDDTVIDEEASVNGMIRYKRETKTVEQDIEQLEVLFLDHGNQLNFIDNIKNPDLAEQYGES